MVSLKTINVWTKFSRKTFNRHADDFSLDRRSRAPDIVIPRAVLVGYFVESCSQEGDPFISYRPRTILTSVVVSHWNNNKFPSVNSFQLFHMIWYVKDYSDESLGSSWNLNSCLVNLKSAFKHRAQIRDNWDFHICFLDLLIFALKVWMLKCWAGALRMFVQ